MDLSERFKGRIQLQKFIDKGYQWWLSAEGNISFLKSNDISLRFNDQFDTDNKAPYTDYVYSNINTNLAFNFTIHQNAMASVGFEYSTERINRSLDEINQFYTRFKDKKIYQHNNFALFFKFYQNSLNEKYYSTSGNNLQIISKYYFGDKYNLYDLENISPSLYTYLSPTYSFYYQPTNLVSLIINENYVLPVGKRFALKFNGFLGTHVSSIDKEEKEGSPYLFLNQKFNIGGSENNFKGNSPEFNGLRQKEVPINSFAKTGLEVQYNFYKSFYLTPSFQYGKGSHELSPFKDSDEIYGYGINLGYESILGPINLNIPKNNILPFWRVYFSIGFKF